MRAVVLALCIVACAPETPPEAPAKPVAATQERPGRSDMRGEWRLTEMNGRAPAPDATGEMTPVTMTVGDTTFRAQSQCIAFWRRYQWSEGRLVVTEVNPVAMCGRGLSSWETEFGRTLSRMTEASRDGETLRLRGPAGSLSFQAAPPQRSTPIAGRWRLHAFNGSAPPRGPEPTIEITISDDRIDANACVFAGWRFRRDGDLMEVTSAPGAECERMTSEFERRFETFMDHVTRATIIPGGALILDSGALQAEFRRLG